MALLYVLMIPMTREQMTDEAVRRGFSRCGPGAMQDCLSKGESGFGFAAIQVYFRPIRAEFHTVCLREAYRRMDRPFIYSVH